MFFQNNPNPILVIPAVKPKNVMIIFLFRNKMPFKLMILQNMKSYFIYILFRYFKHFGQKRLCTSFWLVKLLKHHVPKVYQVYILNTSKILSNCMINVYLLILRKLWLYPDTVINRLYPHHVHKNLPDPIGMSWEMYNSKLTSLGPCAGDYH